MNRSATTVGSPPPLAVLAHELRTPLAAIVGMADAMTAEVMGPLPAAYGEYARSIRQAGLHTLAVLGALIEPGSAADAPLEAAGQVVQDVIEAMRQGLAEKGLRLDLDLKDSASHARVHGRVLGQILFNLLANALKFTGRGGQVAVRLVADQDRLRLEVADSGAGPGATTDGRPPSGAGLGLGIVRALCAAHGGAFAIEITPAGATARAWLAAEAPA